MNLQVGSAGNARSAGVSMRLRSLHVLRTSRLLLAAVVCTGLAFAQSPELFIATNFFGQVMELDPSTGAFLGKKTVPHPVVGTIGLTESDGMLMSIEGVCTGPCERNHLVAIRPADAGHHIIGPTGLVNFQFAVSLEKDPVTGRFYAVGSLTSAPTIFSLYEVDPLSGLMQLIAQITGTAPNDWCTALAIDSAGRAIVTGYNNPRIYELDLSTGIVTLLGSFGLGAGRFIDLAFSQSGVLWGVYNDHGTGNLDNGLYTIDLEEVRAVKQVHLAQSDLYWGLAFMPAPQFQTYCTAKTGSSGCTPSISAHGIPSATATSGFRIRGREVRNNSNALLMYGLQGPDALPFKGGTLCMRPPIQRTAARSAGGTLPPAEDCTGALAIDLNTFVSLGAGDPALQIAGTTVHCQWLVRDPGFPPPNDAALSDALEFVIGP